MAGVLGGIAGAFSSIGANFSGYLFGTCANNELPHDATPTDIKQAHLHNGVYASMLLGQVPYIILDGVECMSCSMTSSMRTTSGIVNIIWASGASMYKNDPIAFVVTSASGIALNVAIEAYCPQIRAASNLISCVFARIVSAKLTQPW